MSNSTYVCGHRACGLPVHGFRNGWKHQLGGRTGAIPASQKHKPVPVLRAEWERAFDLSTPVEESRSLAAKFRAADRELNGPRHDHTSTQEEGKTMTTTTAPVAVIYTAPTGNRTAGRIHRATCKHIPKGVIQFSPAEASVGLFDATLATCCSVREIDREHAIDMARAAAQREAAAIAAELAAAEAANPVFVPDDLHDDGFGKSGVTVTTITGPVAAAEPEPAPATAPKATRPGALRDLVEAYLREHPGEAFTPYRIGKDLQRSSGAVTNALATLAGLGIAEQSDGTPRTYQLKA